jgi:C1A family cysteine protease
MKLRSRVSLLALAALTAAGCGRTAATQTAAPVSAQAAHVLEVAGVKRQLGYNVERYQAVLSPKAHKVHLTTRGTLPTAVDNRKFCAPVYDQGQLGSCTAFSMGKGLREYLQRKNGEQQTQMSALWLYYNERVHMGQEYIKQDSGANMADGMYVLGNQGCATQESWPYQIGNFTVQPPAAADATAAAWKVKNVQELASFDDVKAAIAQGKPVAFGFTVYFRFQFIGSSGIMSMPWSFEPKMGGHAVLAVGYDDNKQLLTVRNSWGGGWGDHGYFYMPYKFAQDKDKAMEWFTAD